MLPSILASGDPISHVVDKNVAAWLTLSMLSIVAGFAVAFIVLTKASKAIATGPESMGNRRYVTHGRLGQVIEVMCLYLRDEMLVPVMGARLAKSWTPFLLSLFFFILTLNLFGLVPWSDMQEALFSAFGGHPHFDLPETYTNSPKANVYFGGAATASILVTGGLATVAFVAIFYQSFRELGILGTLEHLCGGPDLVRGPLFLWLVIPIIFVVELAGMFIKPAALAIRLFANMVAGHILLAVLFGFGAAAAKAGASTVGVASITLVSGTFAVVISFLELFVALLQAFIFMFLTAVFISLMAHHDDHAHEHGHEDNHDHAHDAGSHGHAAAQVAAH